MKNLAFCNSVLATGLYEIGPAEKIRKDIGPRFNNMAIELFPSKWI
jgi:hypothetical protein